MADQTFPMWYQPEPTVGPVLIRSQKEYDEIEKKDWPPKAPKDALDQGQITAQDAQHSADEAAPEVKKSRLKA